MFGRLSDCSFSLNRAKVVPMTLALRTTVYLSLEREYLPWQAALDNLDYLCLMFDRTEVYGPMKVPSPACMRRQYSSIQDNQRARASLMYLCYTALIYCPSLRDFRDFPVPSFRGRVCEDPRDYIIV